LFFPQADLAKIWVYFGLNLSCAAKLWHRASIAGRKRLSVVVTGNQVHLVKVIYFHDVKAGVGTDRPKSSNKIGGEGSVSADGQIPLRGSKLRADLKARETNDALARAMK
jgi:hypothetical protein